jgi:hypothetical protein
MSGRTVATPHPGAPTSSVMPTTAERAASACPMCIDDFMRTHNRPDPGERIGPLPRGIGPHRRPPPLEPDPGGRQPEPAAAHDGGVPGRRPNRPPRCCAATPACSPLLLALHPRPVEGACDPATGQLPAPPPGHALKRPAGPCAWLSATLTSTACVDEPFMRCMDGSESSTQAMANALALRNTRARTRHTERPVRPTCFLTEHGGQLPRRQPPFMDLYRGR